MRTEEEIRAHSITPDEYKLICERLGHEPNELELGIYAVMWSEHCSYKSSKKWLKELPTEGKHVLQGPGENAGIVDIGDGYGLAFKIESHNHPSYVEPFQGAATGVGGILRDVFTMGARPIASMDSIHFGNPVENRKNNYLLNRVVAGISWYGNCIGVPTVGGETKFDDIYSCNPLVNAFTSGLVRHDRIRRGLAAGIGNPVIYVGTRTGRDGIHGATFASDQLTEDSDEDRPAVQVGDPFSEKLLMEACMELFETDYVVGIQDMGAAGLTSSSTEMAERGNVGIRIDLSKVPQREENMTPYEIMLSESQERMLLIARKGTEEEIEKIFRKWDLNYACIGEVIEEEEVQLYHNGELAGRIPLNVLSPPVYDRPREERAPSVFDHNSVSNNNVKESFIRVLSECPSMGYLGNVFHTYDYQVGTNTVIGPGSDSAVLRIKESDIRIAMNLESNARLCYLNPREGARAVMAEAVLNQACIGAEPLGITNCLNFGSPEKPQIMWEFAEVIMGMKESLEFFHLPVTGGNVSFYNDFSEKSIFPTPVIGIVGKIRHGIQEAKAMTGSLYMLGHSDTCLSGSVFLRHLHGSLGSSSFSINLEQIKNLQQLILSCFSKKLISCAHDVSDGGVIYAVLEWIAGRSLGAVLSDPELENPCFAFSEMPGRVLAIAGEENEEELKNLADKTSVPIRKLGSVTSREEFAVNGTDWGLTALKDSYYKNTRGLRCFVETE